MKENVLEKKLLTEEEEREKVLRDMYIPESKYYNSFEDFTEYFGYREGTDRLKNSLFYKAYKYACDNGGKYRFELLVDGVHLSYLIRLVASESQTGVGRDVYLIDRHKFSSQIYEGFVIGTSSPLVVRVKEQESGNIVEMKLGKLIRALLKENNVIEKLGSVICNYYIETVCDLWKAYNDDEGLELHVNDEFERIYSTNHTREGHRFGSCQMDCGQEDFYENCFEGKVQAAYLEDPEDDSVVARCLIFTAKDQNNEIYRLAERQYSYEGEDKYKFLLVRKLIDGGHIDGYKTIKAGAYDRRDFIANDGTSLYESRFRVPLNLEPGDSYMFMDSFAYYVMEEGYACNRIPKNHNYLELDEVNGTLDDNRNYDDYNDEYVNDDLTDVMLDDGSTQTVAQGYADDNFTYSDYEDCYLDNPIWDEYLEEYVCESTHERLEQEREEQEREEALSELQEVEAEELRREREVSPSLF